MVCLRVQMGGGIGAGEHVDCARCSQRRCGQNVRALREWQRLVEVAGRRTDVQRQTCRVLNSEDSRIDTRIVKLELRNRTFDSRVSVDAVVA